MSQRHTDESRKPTHPIGSRVTMRSENLTQIREVVANSTWASQNSLTAHFGLGQRTRIDLVIVRWPSGLHERFPPPPIDSVLTLLEGTHTPTDPPSAVEDFNEYE